MLTKLIKFLLLDDSTYFTFNMLHHNGINCTKIVTYSSNPRLQFNQTKYMAVLEAGNYCFMYIVEYGL